VIFVDTSILIRLLDTDEQARLRAVACLVRYREEGEVLVTSTQCLIEFWVVATRPRQVNGLGLSANTAALELQRFELLFAVLSDPPDLFLRWRKLVCDIPVTGKRAHDARIAAWMIEHGVERVITYNVSDFRSIPGVVPSSP
jgi:predicted nucleic acid-binding protein